MRAIEDATWPRIPPIDDWVSHPERDELLKATPPGRGRPPNLFLTLARHPTLMKRTNIMAGAFMAKGLLPARDRELVILYTAHRTACDYEFRHHLRFAVEVGLTREYIADALGARAETAGKDLVLLRVTDSLLAREQIPESLWQAARQTLGTEELMELVLLVGFYAMLAGFILTIGVEPEPELPAMGLDVRDP